MVRNHTGNYTSPQQGHILNHTVSANKIQRQVQRSLKRGYYKFILPVVRDTQVMYTGPKQDKL